MSKDHWITVKATKKGSKVEFEPICGELWDGRKFVFDKTKLQMGNGDHHKLMFVLDDRTGLGLRFPSIAEDAMWVKQIPDVNSYECPGKDDHDYEVLRPHNVIDGGTKLIAFNSNPDERKWAFSLNFVKDNEDEADVSKFVCWDPIGDNRDGGSGFTSGSLLTLASVAVGSGVISALATTWALMRFTC